MEPGAVSGERQIGNAHPSVGQILMGKVVTHHQFGAIIELPGYNQHGFIRVSQDDASANMCEGEYVWAKVVDVETDEFGSARIVLSMEEAGEDLVLESGNVRRTADARKSAHIEEESLASAANVNPGNSIMDARSDFRIENSIPIDNSMLSDIEQQTMRIGCGIDHLLKEMKEKLHKFSQLTVSSVEIYRLSVDELSQALCGATDHGHELITLCDELNDQFSTAQNLAAQIKSIKLVLDGLENVLR